MDSLLQHRRLHLSAVKKSSGVLHRRFPHFVTRTYESYRLEIESNFL